MPSNDSANSLALAALTLTLTGLPANAAGLSDSEGGYNAIECVHGNSFEFES